MKSNVMGQDSLFHIRTAIDGRFLWPEIIFLECAEWKKSSKNLENRRLGILNSCLQRLRFRSFLNFNLIYLSKI